MSSTPRRLEFVASVGPGIDVQWVETDEVSLLQDEQEYASLIRRNEAVCITVRRRPSLQSVHATSQESCRPSNGWSYSERSERGTRIIAFRSVDGAEKDLEDNNKSKETEKVQRKIQDLWKEKFDETTANLDLWLKAPNTFFGELDRSSNERWSFEFISGAEEKYPGRIPFHKLNLALHLRRRVRASRGALREGHFIEINCRKAMMKECCPNYDQLDDRAKESVKRQYNRYIEQGDILGLMWNICAGLVLIIAPFLTRDDLRLVKTHLDDFSNRWLTPEAKEKAKKCETLAFVILRYVHGINNSLSHSKRKAQTLPSERSKRRQRTSISCSGDHSEGPITGTSQTNLRLRDPILDKAMSDIVPILPPSVNMEKRVHATVRSIGTSNPLLPETFIPPLFYAMGGRVPKIMIDRATSPQRRWSESGDVLEIQPHDAGLHQDLVDILSDRTELPQSIERLILLSTIEVEISADGMESYICQCKSAQVSFDLNQASWICRAFELCCYVFPRKRVAEPLFGPVGKKMLSVLQHLLRSFAEMDLEIPSSNDAVETLLAAASLGNLSSRRQLLTIAAKLHKDPAQVHLQAEVVHQQSVLLRFEGKMDESQRVIKEFFDGPYLKTKPRSHLLLGLLHLSQANNLVYNFQFPQAHEEAQTWQPPRSTPSQGQLDVLWEQIYCAGRIFRGEGRFEEAKECFEHCLAASRVPESKRILITSNLADLYCELHYQRKQERTMPDVQYPDTAKNIIQSEVERMRTRGLHSKGFRRLLLSSVEIEINEDRYSKAEHLIKELLAIYDKLTEPDIVDRLGHVRALIALARISPLSEAEERWGAALQQNAIYNPLEEEVFTCAVIYLFISFVRFKLQQIDESKKAFSRAQDIIGKRKPQFLIPGIGTYLFEYIRLQLQSVAGYQLEERTLA